MKIDLRNIASIFNGKTPSKGEQRDVGFPVLKIKDIDDRGFFKGHFDCFIDENLASNLSKKHVQVGDILILNAAHNSKYVGTKKAFATSDFAGALATGEWTIVRPNRDKVLPQFLFFILNSNEFQFELQNIVKGIHLYPKDLGGVKVYCPSLEEQKRIVHTLDQANSLRQKRQKAISLLDGYLKAVFFEMFGDPISNPKSIKTAKIKSLGDIVTGSTPSRKVSENYGDFIEWIKSDNINNHHHYLTRATEYLSETGLQKGRSVPAGSILVTCIAGSLSCIGNVSMTDRKVAFNQQINAIVPKPGIEPSFLYSQILFGKKKFRQASTNSMKGMLSKTNFSEIELINPDEDLQKEYARIFDSTYELKQKMLNQSNEIDKEFQALMQGIFSYSRGEKEKPLPHL